jgi:hypothetical protein
VREIFQEVLFFATLARSALEEIVDHLTPEYGGD